MADHVSTTRGSSESLESPMDIDPNDAAIGGAVAIAIAHARAGKQPLNICDMNDDCCKETFSYLLLQDLVSMGRTCKRMNQIVLDVIEHSYPAIVAQVGTGTIQMDGINLHGFSKSIQSISIFFGEQTDFNYITSNPFDSLKHIRFMCTDLSMMNIERMTKILKQIESLQPGRCKIVSDLYEDMLKHCINLKHLDLRLNSSVITGVGNEWLKQKYPNLEHFSMLCFEITQPIAELSTFFAQNTQIRKLTMDDFILQQNTASIMESELKLETLEIHVCDPLKTVEVLNELHVKGLYQCLGISHVVNYEREISIDINNIKASYLSWCNEMLSALINLRELKFIRWPEPCLEIVAHQLTNLERIDFDHAIIGDIRDLIQYSANLKVMSIGKLTIDFLFNAPLLELPKWNRQRDKLKGARKLTIFVDDEVYLKTKWALKQTDFGLIEIKRIHADKELFKGEW